MTIISCELCEAPTTMTGTKRCDSCWELETRIESNPTLARKILNSLKENAVTSVQYAAFELLRKQGQELIKACDEAMQGKKLPKNVACHLIGIASYIEAVATDIKHETEEEHDR